MDPTLAREASDPGRSRLHPARRLVRSVVAAAASLGALACASEQAPPPAAPVAQTPVRVRVGVIAPSEADLVTEEPGSLPESIELLVDLFWRKGCRGGDLSRSRPEGARYPDVVCRLGGRTPETVVVAAYLDPRSHRGEDWTGPALLPHLYAALSVGSREHSFVFVGFAGRARGGVREDAERLEETRKGRVRAIVDLHGLRGGSSAIGLVSSDPRLRRDLSAIGRSLPGTGEPLQLLALPDRTGSSFHRTGVPTIRAVSLGPAPDAGATTRVIAVDAREAFRSSARAVAVFLGYVDRLLRGSAEFPAADAPRR